MARKIMIVGSLVWASLWTHLWIRNQLLRLEKGRKDLHISSTTCCGVREKCGTAGKEPKKKESPHEIERDIYIVLSLVLVWLWALYMTRPLPSFKFWESHLASHPTQKKWQKRRFCWSQKSNGRRRRRWWHWVTRRINSNLRKKNQSALFHEHDPHAILFYLKS